MRRTHPSMNTVRWSRYGIEPSHARTSHRADRDDKAARKNLRAHRSRDQGKEDDTQGRCQRERAEALRKEAEGIRPFLRPLHSSAAAASLGS